MSAEPAPTRCSRCDRTYAASPDEPHRCECGGWLELDETLDAPTGLTGPVDHLRSFRPWLPTGPFIDLGAGGTPLVDAPQFDAQFKLETCNPTGSFKDRGAAMTVGRAVGLGANLIKEDSSGNAGRATATYAARAGIDATVFVPADAGEETLAAIRATGATLEVVEGDRSAVESACLAHPEGWYASHAWRPEFYAGTATCAFELVADGGGVAPTAICLPVGHGTLLIGLFRGFTRLRGAGVIDRLPRLYAAQLEGAGSLVPAGDTAVDPTIAPGVRIVKPARHAEVDRAIESTGGSVVAVEPDRVLDCRDRLARAGFDVCSTAALGVCGRERLREEGTEPAEVDVVVPLTGRSRDR